MLLSEDRETVEVFLSSPLFLEALKLTPIDYPGRSTVPPFQHTYGRANAVIRIAILYRTYESLLMASNEHWPKVIDGIFGNIRSVTPNNFAIVTFLYNQEPDEIITILHHCLICVAHNISMQAYLQARADVWFASNSFSPYYVYYTRALHYLKSFHRACQVKVSAEVAGWYAPLRASLFNNEVMQYIDPGMAAAGEFLQAVRANGLLTDTNLRECWVASLMCPLVYFLMADLAEVAYCGTFSMCERLNSLPITLRPLLLRGQYIGMDFIWEPCSV